MIHVSVTGSEKEFRTLVRSAERTIRAALAFLQRKDAGVAVYLVADRDMRELSRRTRGKNIPATVLSFPEPLFWKSRHPISGYLGEIYLAPRYIRKKKEDFSRLLIHGLLHLLGYEHKTKKDREKMERTENRIIMRIQKTESRI